MPAHRYSLTKRISFASLKLPVRGDPSTYVQPAVAAGGSHWSNLSPTIGWFIGSAACKDAANEAINTAPIQRFILPAPGIQVESPGPGGLRPGRYCHPTPV